MEHDSSVFRDGITFWGSTWYLFSVRYLPTYLALSLNNLGSFRKNFDPITSFRSLIRSLVSSQSSFDALPK